MGAGNFVANNCRIIPTRLGTVTTPVICLTAQGFTQIIGARIVNTHATNTPIVNLIYKPVADGINYFIQANYTMPVACSLWFPFDAFGVNINDQILVQQSIASSVDTFLFVAEVPGRSQ
jgi:hypothetical protein